MPALRSSLCLAFSLLLAQLSVGCCSSRTACHPQQCVGNACITPLLNRPIIHTPILNRPIINTPILNTPIINTPILNRPLLAGPVVAAPVGYDVAPAYGQGFPAGYQDFGPGYGYGTPIYDGPIANAPHLSNGPTGCTNCTGSAGIGVSTAPSPFQHVGSYSQPRPSGPTGPMPVSNTTVPMVMPSASNNGIPFDSSLVPTVKPPHLDGYNDNRKVSVAGK